MKLQLTGFSTKGILVISILSLAISSLIAQPGIYNESDIEFQTLFLEAQYEKYQGNTDKQAELLQEIIKRDKKSHAAYYELARLYLKTGDLELAQKNADKAHLIQPNNEYYLLILSEVMEKSNQHGKAVLAYEKLKQLNPQNPTIYHKLAQLHLHENMPDKAVQNLELLQKNQGVDEETSRRIFEIYKNTGNEKKAVQTLERLVDAYPDNTRLMHNLANYHLETGNEKGAKQVYQKILTIDPNDSAATIAAIKDKQSNPTGGGDNALLALEPMITNMNLPLDDKLKELIPYLTTIKKGDATTGTLASMSQKLVSLYPDDAKVYSMNGDINFYQGKYTESEKDYEKAITIDDRKYTLWSQYMQNLWELEKIAKLVEISEEAIDLYPNKVSAFLFHALSQTDKSVAKDMLQEASFIAGKNPSLVSSVSIVSQWLDINNANKKEIKAIDLNALAEPIYFELAGDLYASIDDNNMAKKLWDKAIDLGSSENRISKKINSN